MGGEIKKATRRILLEFPPETCAALALDLVLGVSGNLSETLDVDRCGDVVATTIRCIEPLEQFVAAVRLATKPA